MGKISWAQHYVIGKFQIDFYPQTLDNLEETPMEDESYWIIETLLKKDSETSVNLSQ